MMFGNLTKPSSLYVNLNNLYNRQRTAFYAVRWSVLWDFCDVKWDEAKHFVQSNEIEHVNLDIFFVDRCCYI